MSVRVIHGDCRAVMGGMGPDGVDAIVTDPPYLLEFMGKEFDRQHKGMDGSNAGVKMQAWHLSWAREAYRVLRPGGHLLAFGGSRTYHRLACSIEDAGFEIRDQVMWLYGSGFPKSRDVSKAIDEEAGAERDVVGSKIGRPGVSATGANMGRGFGRAYEGRDDRPEPSINITAPATDAARRWDGWGTALKPAHEPIVLARKPLSEKTVAANVLAHGTGALNVDACRVAGTPEPTRFDPHKHSHEGWRMTATGDDCAARASHLGRWPGNVIHDGSDEVEAAFAAFGSDKGAAAPVRRRNGDKFQNAYGAFKGDVDEAGSTFHGDTGTASRFFYCAKAGRNERWKHVVCRCLAQVIPPGHVVYKLKHCPVCGDEFRVTAHPTQKPESLMRYLCRLITPPGGTVLDMFAGSGSTGCAALAEGFGFVGIEADAIYAGIAEARIAAARVSPKAKAKSAAKARVPPVSPPDLFSVLAAD